MRHSIFTAATISLALILAGCQQQPSTMPTHAFVKKGVTMSLDPPAAPDCKPMTTYTATLNWSVDVSVTSKTEVRIGKPDGGLFARSNDQKAHQDTGKWVRPGAWFLLFDRRTGEMIGALQAGPTPCP
jgi:hypothetical protein